VPRRAAVSAGSAKWTCLELLDDEAPARRRLQRHLELLAAEVSGEASYSVAVGGRNPLARDLARFGVQPLGGDLRSVLVESHYDRQQGPPQAPRSKRLRDTRRA